MVQQAIFNKTKRIEGHDKGSQSKSQWLAPEAKIL